MKVKILKLLFLAYQLGVVRGLPGQQCTTVYRCREFAMTATFRSDLGLNVNAILSTSPQSKSMASLNGRPFTFDIPPFLNISSGNSGGQFQTSTLSFIVASGPSTESGGGGTIAGAPIITCTYTGIGVSSPWYPEEIAAANAYQFSSCAPATGLGVGSAVQVSLGVV